MRISSLCGRDLRLSPAKLAGVIDLLSKFAKKYRNTATLGFTHYQAAQLTTVGKRATLWAYEFAMDLAEIENRISKMPFRGIKGTTGTQASFLALFGGNHKKVKQLDKMVAKAFGFENVCAVTGQTYQRKIDAQVVNALASIAQSAHKMCNDIRLLANLKEIEEPFEKSQVGSSAMAYKTKSDAVRKSYRPFAIGAEPCDKPADDGRRAVARTNAG